MNSASNQVTLHLPARLLDGLDSVANSEDLSRTEVVRKTVECFLANNGIVRDAFKVYCEVDGTVAYWEEPKSALGKTVSAPPLTEITTSLPAPLLHLVASVANGSGRTRSQITRDAIASYLEDVASFEKGLRILDDPNSVWIPWEEVERDLATLVHE